MTNDTIRYDTTHKHDIFYFPFNSEETCNSYVAEECADLIPYTTYPNTLFGINGTEEYHNFSNAIQQALQNCTMDEYWARWGVCNIMFPRCLQGWELQLCRDTCLRM